jgi:hypothetical protein
VSISEFFRSDVSRLFASLICFVSWIIIFNWSSLGRLHQSSSRRQMLNKLSNELLLAVVKYCERPTTSYYECFPPALNPIRLPTLSTLCRVNKRLNQLVTPRLYSDISTSGLFASRLYQILSAIVHNRSLANHHCEKYDTWFSGAEHLMDSCA